MAGNSETAVYVFPLGSRTETANAQKQICLGPCHSSCPRICLVVVVVEVYSVYTHPFRNPSQVGDDLDLVPSGLHTVVAAEAAHAHS